LEIQSRTAHAPRRLTGAVAWLLERRAAVVAFAVALALAALIVAAQPLRSPWWTYADADASYTGAALNLVAGYPAQFVDHPGLPLTEATALVFGADALLRGHVSHADREAYVDTRLLDLDRTRTVFRGLAALLYLAGAALAFLLIARLFGHWTWGLAGSLLWLATPGLQPMAIQLRPDVALALCCLVFAYLVGRAVEMRDARLYAGAAFVAGLALMLKLHAIGLLVPLVVAALWRPPRIAWRPPWQRLAWVAAALVAVSIVLNVDRLPYTPTAAQLIALVSVLGLTGAATFVAAWRHAGVVPPAYAAGVLLPVLLDPQDGLQALVVLAKSAAGRGVSDVPSFTTPISALDGLLSFGGLVLLAIAAAAAVVGLRRGDARPVVWTVGAVALGVLAWARPVAPHYLAPSAVLAIPAALWLIQTAPRARASLLIWPFVLLIAWPALDNRDASAESARALEAAGQTMRARALAGLGPNDVRFVPSYSPDPDVRYFELVQLYVRHSPDYPYRLLPMTDAALSYAEAHGLEPK
jgi:hypothetical protein